MQDAIVDLGYCAAVCELEAHLCPWDRAELRKRAAAYRTEQRRLLAALELPACSNCRMRGEPRPTKPGSRNRKPRSPRRVFA